MSFHTNPASWHFVHVSVFFGSQAGKRGHLGMTIHLGLKKSVSSSVAFQAAPLRVRPGEMLRSNVTESEGLGDTVALSPPV